MKSDRLVRIGSGLLVCVIFLTGAVVAVGEAGAKFPFTGVIKNNSVNVRSGPETNYYAVSRLMRDNKVQVVGEEYGWYKIVPPAGSFSWVSKEYVEKKDGAKGVITGDRVSIRAGSNLSDKKTVIQLLGNKGMEVTILGEEGDWYKIAPPEGAFLWVSAQFVKPESQVAQPAVAAVTPAPGTTTKPAVEEGTVSTTEKETATVTVKKLESVTTQATNPPSLPGSPRITRKEITVRAVTTQPSEEQQEALGKFTREFIELDKKLMAEMKKPLPDRKFDELVAGYTPIAEQTQNKTAAKFAKDRLAMIDYQKEAVQGHHMLTEIREQYEMETRAKLPEPKETFKETNPETYRFQGCGILRPSLVFEGPLMPSRYRLFDPEKCRTIAYVELAPGVRINMSQYVSKNVAVYGSSCFDAKLGFRVIQADAFKLITEQPKITNNPSVIE